MWQRGRRTGHGRGGEEGGQVSDPSVENWWLSEWRNYSPPCIEQLEWWYPERKKEKKKKSLACAHMQTEHTVTFTLYYTRVMCIIVYRLWQTHHGDSYVMYNMMGFYAQKYLYGKSHFDINSLILSIYFLEAGIGSCWHLNMEVIWKLNMIVLHSVSVDSAPCPRNPLNQSRDVGEGRGVGITTVPSH